MSASSAGKPPVTKPALPTCGADDMDGERYDMRGIVRHGVPADGAAAGGAVRRGGGGAAASACCRAGGAVRVGTVGKEGGNATLVHPTCMRVSECVQRNAACLIAVDDHEAPVGQRDGVARDTGKCDVPNRHGVDLPPACTDSGGRGCGAEGRRIGEVCYVCYVPRCVAFLPLSMQRHACIAWRRHACFIAARARAGGAGPAMGGVALDAQHSTSRQRVPIIGGNSCLLMQMAFAISFKCM